MKKTFRTTAIVAAMFLGICTVALDAHSATDTSNSADTMMDEYEMGPGMMGYGYGHMMGRGGMMGYGGGMGMMYKLTPEQREQFYNETKELRKKMYDLRFEYMEAMHDPKSSPQDLAKIEKEMLETKVKMLDKMNSMKLK
ncbi:MAG: Spy/CpxP family protein refolding chaperone [Desulfobulbus sp.]|nr:Spy/CpxP family protein refolding chaperone [Desulfobulbus sp.]